MTLIQIGFLSELNWGFVALNSQSAAQIMQLLPQGVSEGLNLQSSEVVIHSLVPLDTASYIGYITTTALLFIPTTMVPTLTLDLQIPVSALYQNSDSTINQLMSLINPNIPLIPGDNLSGSAASGTGSSATATAAAGNNDGVFSTNTADQNSQTSAATRNTAVIAVSAVGAAAAYGAAMFFIARRYKKKKQGHRRSSSIMSPSEMRQSGSPALIGGGAYMTGGRSSSGGDRNSRGSGRTGNSARTQQISAPMMAENSLGWN